MIVNFVRRENASGKSSIYVIDLYFVFPSESACYVFKY